MGDMGMFKRRPCGWIAGQAFARTHRTRRTVRNDGSAETGESVIDLDDLSLLLDAEWEVHVPGREPYTVTDVRRKAPSWLDRSIVAGRGKRFWSLRLRGTGGLRADVGLPCLVDPDDPTRLWIDWDAGYDLHVPAWDRDLAIDGAVDRRRGGIDAVLGKVLSPLRPWLDPADEHVVEERLAAERALAPQDQAEAPLLHRALNPGETPPDPAEHEEVAEQVRRTVRLHQTGREAPTTVVAITPTGRLVCATPEYELHLDVDDEGTIRRVVHREVMGDAWAGRMAAGTRTLVCVDPVAPDRIALAKPGRLASRISGGYPALKELGLRHERIVLTGRWADAVIVSAEATGGTLHGGPEWVIHLDVTDDGTVRRVVHHEPLLQTRPPWVPGARTGVRIDPDDPTQVTFA